MKLKNIFNKFFCKHDLIELVRTYDRSYGITTILYSCTYCSKIKKIQLNGEVMESHLDKVSKLGKLQ
ncbi:MAG: hypothetical protein WC755_09775 [Candidatus Woesearchaeota archaeon]|jgi:hypothetical protein